MKKMNLFVCICVVFCMIFSMTAFADDVAAVEETVAVEEVAEATEEVAAEATEETAEEVVEEAEEVAEEVKEEAATEETATEETAEEVKEEATEEAAVEVAEKNYDDVSAFDRLRSYEIMQGDEDGNLNLEDDVTRAEMAQFIINAKNLKKVEYTVPADEELFTDLPADHWAYKTIYLAKSLGVINGNGDGTFEPEGKVTYEQAVKMIVNLMGYSSMAEELGGYPNGHLAVATVIGLTKNVEFVQTESAIRKDIAIMLDTALDIPVMEQVGFGSEPEYKILSGSDGTDRVTLASEFEVSEEATTEETATEETVEETTEETEATEETVEETTEETEAAEEAAEEVAEETEATEEATEETAEKTEE